MNVDLYLGDDASKDLAAVSIKMIDTTVTEIPQPSKEYRIIRYRENEPGVKEVFDAIKTDLKLS